MTLFVFCFCSASKLTWCPALQLVGRFEKKTLLWLCVHMHQLSPIASANTPHHWHNGPLQHLKVKATMQL